MEGTKSEELTRVRSSKYSKTGRKSYNRSKGNEDNTYKKAIITLKILICIGFFTVALLIRVVNVSFTNDMRGHIKSSLSSNISISEIYKSSIDKVKSIFTINNNISDGIGEEKAETEKKLEETTKKLVPTLEE